jgi:hypothetical protein
MGLRKSAMVASATVVLALGTIGFAHTRMGRPLLGWLHGAPGCPALNAQVPPARVEAFRIAELERRRGENAAGATPAMSFTLGTTTRKDVDAWIAARAASCSSERADSVLRCTRVDTESTTHEEPLPDAVPIEDLFMQFDPSGRLVAVDALRRGRTTDAAVDYVKALALYLEKTVGPATKPGAEPSAAYLDGHPFDRFASEYRYVNYVAEISAMNFGRRGVRVREQYQWLPSAAATSAAHGAGEIAAQRAPL